MMLRRRPLRLVSSVFRSFSWFVGAAPLDDPQWVIAVVIEHGGSGGQVAAPTARRVLQFLMGEELDKIESGDVSEVR